MIHHISISILRRIVTLILVTSAYTATGQHTIDDLLDIKAVQVLPLESKNLLDNTITIRTEFAETEFSVPRKCHNVDIVAVDYYYSNFQSTLTFQQRELNKQRFERLLQELPQVKEQRVRWNVYGQDVNGVDKARKVFHGFVLHYRKVEDAEELQAELTTFAAIRELSKPDSCVMDTVEYVKEKNKYIKTGLYKPKSRRKAKRGVKYKRKGVWGRRPHKTKETEYITKTRVEEVCYLSRSAQSRLDSALSTYSNQVPTNKSPGSISFTPPPSDQNVISTVMERNKDWNNLVVIMDATTSMYPYVPDMLLWCELNFVGRDLRAFYFFTDVRSGGSSKFKRNGGVVYVKPEEYQQMAATLNYAFIQSAPNMDMPENDAEALSFCLKQHKDDDDLEYVMVVDNLSSVKGLESIRKVKHPVHVIVCGARNQPIHPDYLYIAYHTGGSVHTVEEDIETLAALNEGSTIKLNGASYIILDGKFVKR